MAFLIRQHTRLQARQRIQKCHGNELATGHHEIAQADLNVNMGVNEPLVNTFITAAQQDCSSALRPFLHRQLVEPPPDGREKYHGHRMRLGTLNADMLQSAQERLGHKHHPGATTERAVINTPVVAFRKISGIGEMHLHLTALERSPGDANLQKGIEQLRKQRDDVKAHTRGQ